MFCQHVLIVSQQPTCSVNENDKILTENIERLELIANDRASDGPLSHETTTHINNLKGLRAAFQCFMANVYENGGTLR